MMGTRKRLDATDYRVAWICPVVDLELLPSRLLLDDEHDIPQYDQTYDDNVYICGDMEGHNVVLATRAEGSPDDISAGGIAGHMLNSFPDIRMILVVGIGSAVPNPFSLDDPTNDVRLGDVVVGWPNDGRSARINYDSDGRLNMLGTVDQPDRVFSKALAALASDRDMKKNTFRNCLRYLHKSSHRDKFDHPGLDQDRLYQTDYRHSAPHGTCTDCDKARLVVRTPRIMEDEVNFRFHRGRIATTSAVVQDGEQRDRVNRQCGGVMCIEMEAAGFDVPGRCLVIRGISDYADSHKNDLWRSFAAGNAAALARALLCEISPDLVKGMVKLSSEAPFMVPFCQNPHLTNRFEVLDQLKTHLSRYESKRLALCGPSGSGKTALAAEFAHSIRRDQPQHAVFWVPALTPQTFKQAYQDIGKALRIPQILCNQADNKTDAMQLVKERLNNEDSQPWLMIIDNADDMSVLLNTNCTKNGTRLIDYFPCSRKGSIIITTRTPTAAMELAGSHWIHPERDEIEARVLSEKRAERKKALLDDTAVMLELLNCVPLATLQAIAFINNNGISVAKYIDLFIGARSTSREILASLRVFLELMSCFPLAIVRAISFTSRNRISARKYVDVLAAARSVSRRIALLKRELSRKLMLLSRELIALSAHGRYEDAEQIYRKTVRLRQRIQGNEHPETITTMNNLAIVLSKQEKYEEAEQIHRQTLQLSQKIRGQENLLTIAIMDNLALVLLDQGKYQDAEPIHRQALQLRQKVQGCGNPSTLTTMNNLALVLSRQGKFEEAERINRQALQLRPNEHPETITTMNNLALVLSKQGKYEESEEMHRRTLQLSRRIIGEEDPLTLTLMDNLAMVLSDQAKYGEAERLFRQTLQLREKVQGKDDRSTVTTMKSLILVLCRQGKHGEAEQIVKPTGTSS